jgi:hypothetical protein
MLGIVIMAIILFLAVAPTIVSVLYLTDFYVREDYISTIQGINAELEKERKILWSSVEWLKSKDKEVGDELYKYIGDHLQQ